MARPRFSMRAGLDRLPSEQFAGQHGRGRLVLSMATNLSSGASCPVRGLSSPGDVPQLGLEARRGPRWCAITGAGALVVCHSWGSG